MPARRRSGGGYTLRLTMANRSKLHALLDEIPDGDLPLAREALELIRGGFDVTDDERRELQERFAACDRGEGVDARGFLDRLRRQDDAPTRG